MTRRCRRHTWLQKLRAAINPYPRMTYTNQRIGDGRMLTVTDLNKLFQEIRDQDL